MEKLQQILTEVQRLSHEGGIAFAGLIILGFLIAFTLLSLFRFMRYPDPPLLNSREWIRLLNQKTSDDRQIQLLDRRLRQDLDSRAQQLQGISQRLFAALERRFPFAFTLVESAPLVGLLGTVAGMLATFRGLGSSATDGVHADLISKGIAEALICTQTGLIIGVPTFVVCSIMKSWHERRKAAFERIESQLLQLASPTDNP